MKNDTTIGRGIRLKEVIKLAKLGIINYLYISSIDRLGRDTSRLLQLIRILTESGMVAKTVDETTHNGLNSDGKPAQ